MQFPDFHPKNPLRDLHWRWGRAGDILAGGPQLSRRRDDRWVKDACAFRQAINKPQGAHALYLLADQFPALCWAYRFWSGRNENETKLHTHALEARILANEPPDVIAEKLNTEVDVVEAYERVFYDARPNLHRVDYVLFKAIGEAIGRGLRARDFDCLWKLMAIYGGPHVLDTMISGYAGLSRPDSTDGVSGFFRDAVGTGLRQKAIQASMTMEANNFTATAILDVYYKSIEIEQKRGADTQSSIFQNIQMAFSGLQYTVGEPGKDGDKIEARPTLDALDMSAAELRGDELLAIGSGRTLEGENAILASSFPPPPPRLAAPEE